MAGEYSFKYAFKPNKLKLTAGDTILACMEHLQPENALTTGTFAKMYNKVADTGPQSIFQCVQNNFGLPLVIKNME